MFTGIVKALSPVTAVQQFQDILHFAVKLPPDLIEGLKLGASVSIDGVCLTATHVHNNTVEFDAIPETLNKTTLNNLEIDRYVNIERAACFGDEIGGHILSGHIWGKVYVKELEIFPNHRVLTCGCPKDWIKYLLPKGYVALDGASLTLVDVNQEGSFTVHLIPETLQRTTLGRKKTGDWINLELDSQTQAIVDTLERYKTQFGVR